MSTADQTEKAAVAAAKKEAAEQAKLAAKAEREAKTAAQAEVKAKAKAERDAAKEAKKAAAEQAKADAKSAKSASVMPEQNGIRRPKPDSVTGKLWAIYDSVSQKNGAPATITEALVIARESKINDATTRTQYARWRAFNGITGRLATAKVAA